MAPKTLHLTNAYHEHSGGIRTMYHALLQQANREHRLMRLVVPGVSDCEERIGRFGLIYHVKAPRAPVGDRRYRMILPHRFVWPGTGRLWSIVNREAPDVLEVTDKYSLCYLSGILRRFSRSDDRPTLVGLTCERLDDNVAAFVRGGRRASELTRAYLGRVYIGMFDAHIANSDYTASELRGAMVSPHERPVHVCPMGVELPASPTADARRSARCELAALIGQRHAPIVVYAGRLSPEKNVDVLPDVLSELLATDRRIHMLIVGDGPSRRQIEARMRGGAAGQAHFLGHLTDRRTLLKFICGADVFIHPNPREPFGIGPLEAMAVGTPLVAANAGGVLSYATSDNAWLADPTPAGFAVAIRAALRDPDERARKAANAEVTAGQFSWRVAASRIFRTYDHIHRQRLAARLVREPARAQPAERAHATDWIAAAPWNEAEALQRRGR
jgi:glycosyltransferase involved in cell wall biosynthesis